MAPFPRRAPNTKHRTAAAESGASKQQYMDRHPQNKVQGDLYEKAVANLRELNANVARMNSVLTETNKMNETAVLVSQLNSSYLDSVTFQLDLQEKEKEKK
jgi:hypothetical protein